MLNRRIQPPPPWLALSLAGLFLAVFACLAWFVLSGRPESFNLQVSRDAQGAAGPWLTRLAVALTLLGSGPGLALVTAVTALLYLRRGRRLDAATIGLAMAGATLWTNLLKLAFQVPRPGTVEVLLPTTGYSFPSGHALLSLTMFGTMAILELEQPPYAGRLGLAAGMLALSLAIMWSRLVLGAHWFTDVLGGLLVGTAWICVCLAARSLGLQLSRKRERESG